MVSLNKKKTYIISTHVSYDKNSNFNYGPPHFIYDYLKERHVETYMIDFPLVGINGIYLSSTVTGSRKKIGRNMGIIFFDTLHSIFINYTRSYRLGRCFFIGVNPVNGIAGVLLKMTFRARRFIYFSADYAVDRFNNSINNFIYHVLDRLSLFFADEVWSVSTRINELRILQGVPKYKCKILPNTPFFNPDLLKEYDGNQNLVIVSHLSKSLNLKPILDALINLTENNHKMHLNIIGSGPEENFFKTMVKDLKLDDHVSFLGFMDHSSVLKELSKSFIGIALYTNENSWNYYGDSMKAREYLACGIPVIINSIPSTSEDIKDNNAGLVLDRIDSDSIYKFIDKCVFDTTYYLNLRSNAIELAKKNDKMKVLNEILPIDD